MQPFWWRLRYREVLGAAEGMKEDKASWVRFFQWLRGRSLDGVKMVAKRCSKDLLRKLWRSTPRRAKKLLGRRPTLWWGSFVP